ncbi:MAG: 3-deoxy-D-manno-octulosonic acid transferase [Saprospiraceae bacterium]
MSLLYTLGVRGYALAAKAAAVFSPKAKARVHGAKAALQNLPATSSNQRCYWMHCASVGEFEQGRPLWDQMMLHDPSARFVLSFFSPSGYDVFSSRKDVGEVVYLPWDIGSNAIEFVSKLSPKLAVFVKYEWWLGYFKALAQQEISTVVVSVAFRQNQPFFRQNLLRKDYQNALNAVEHVFVQDESSASLLKSIGHSEFTVSGDTRIDRTLSNREAALDAPLLSAWAQEASYVMVAGSTWIPDTTNIAEALRAHLDLHLIIAPHEVDEKSIVQTEQVLAKAIPKTQIARLSELRTNSSVSDQGHLRAILIDSIGLLSKLYRLGNIAYIGGGFGAGIHNTLEAAAYGIPLAFGPKYQKFQEAIALVDQNIATEVANAEDLSTFVELYSVTETRKQVLAKAEQYIEQNSGATQRIWDHLIERKLL